MKTFEFYPSQTEEVLYNPYMGWVPMATRTAYKQPHTMVYAPLIWAQLEPEGRGIFDWKGFEERINYDHWKSLGVKINIRFYMDQPARGPHMDIPGWLYDMLGERDGKSSGVTFKGEPYDSCIGVGFTPNYSDPVLIAEHERVLKAIADRYGDDPAVAFIQMGSLGHWGEWHCWPYTKEEGGPSGTFPKTGIADIYISHYLKYFDKKKLCMRRPTGPAAEHGLGLFNDMFGDVPASKEAGNAWYDWIKNGYRDARGENMPAMPDFWKTGVSGGEFANGNAGLYLTDETIEDTLAFARDGHTSWLGPCCPAGLERNGSHQRHIDALLKTMGYRFAVEKAVVSGDVRPGGSMEVKLTWKNLGVAPFYFEWPVYVGLAKASAGSDEPGAIEVKEKSVADLAKFLPGSLEDSVVLNIPEGTGPGRYELVTAIIDPATGKPGIGLANEGKRSDGWYVFGEIEI